MKSLPLLLALAAALPAVPAQAQQPPAAPPSAVAIDNANVADVRCLIVGLVLSGAQDKEAQDGGNAIVGYALGRLDARTPGFDLERAIRAERVKLSLNDVADIGKRCGEALQARVKALTAMTTRLPKG